VKQTAETQRPRHQISTALVQVGLAAVVVVVGRTAGVELRWLITVLIGFGLVALAGPIRALMQRGRQRDAADEWLLWGAVAHPSSPLLSRRAAELVSPRKRSMLARSLRRVERDGSKETVAAPIPLNRRAIRRNVFLVRALHERLDDHSRPIDPRGVVLVERLITVPRSPLYSRDPDDVLAEALGEALAALDPAPLAEAA
jgi:hypothetical protein